MNEIQNLSDVVEASLVALYYLNNNLTPKCVCLAKSEKVGLFHELKCPLGSMGLLEQGLKRQEKEKAK